MKEYNRETKRWEEPNEKEGSLKKKKMCRGNKPHDFQLALPDYIAKNQTFSSEAIQSYYESEQRVLEFQSKEEEFLKSIGIEKRFGRVYNKVHKHFTCSVCGKKEYDIYER